MSRGEDDVIKNFTGSGLAAGDDAELHPGVDVAHIRDPAARAHLDGDAARSGLRHKRIEAILEVSAQGHAGDEVPVVDPLRINA